MRQITIEELRELLHGERAVEFTYIKKDGTNRKAVGSLNESLIPTKDQDVTDSSSNIVYSNMRYYDLEKNGWRSLSQTIETVKTK